MLLSMLSLVSALVDECQAPAKGTVLVKYYLEGCHACTRLTPEIERIQSRIKEVRPEVGYQEVECNECTCEGITSFPTLAIMQDRAITSKSVGYKTYEKIGEWLSSELKIDPYQFIEKDVAVKKLSGEAAGETHTVKELIARDFLSGFEGQWLILFYEDEHDPNREHFRALAESFGGRLRVGEVKKSEAVHVTNRFNVTEYPYIAGVNHGNIVPFAADKTLRELRRFAERLVRPNFESLTYKELMKMAAKHTAGEPVYIVLYKSYEIASHFFNDLAQQFKFRANIYKSNDLAMFEAAGVHPKDYKDFEKIAEHEERPGHHEDGASNDYGEKEKKIEYHDIDYNQMVKLLVYKNHTFYASNIPLENGNDIVQWIFHTHFSHVTNISNENFYTVFHGIKPVLILLTSDEHYLEEFNQASADRHLGTPYTTVLFATLDVAEYPLFKKQVLPLLRTPALAFYDPVSVRWYVDSAGLGKMDARAFSNEVARVIDKYMANKLPAYPPKKSYMRYYMIGLWAGLIVAFFCFKTVSDRQKME